MPQLNRHVEGLSNLLRAVRNTPTFADETGEQVRRENGRTRHSRPLRRWDLAMVGGGLNTRCPRSITA